MNASGSYHELRKLRTAYTLVESASMKVCHFSPLSLPVLLVFFVDRLLVFWVEWGLLHVR